MVEPCSAQLPVRLALADARTSVMFIGTTDVDGGLVVVGVGVGALVVGGADVGGLVVGGAEVGGLVVGAVVGVVTGPPLLSCWYSAAAFGNAPLVSTKLRQEFSANSL